MKTEGVKHDEGKSPLGLLDGYALEQVALVMAMGEKKYGRHNWRGGFKYSRLIDAALRHIFAFNDGTDYDPESNLSPLAHAICMLVFLLRMQKDRPDLDDRYLAGAKEGDTKKQPAGFKSAIESAKLMCEKLGIDPTVVREDGEPTREEVELLMDSIRRAES